MEAIDDVLERNPTGSVSLGIEEDFGVAKVGGTSCVGEIGVGEVFKVRLGEEDAEADVVVVQKVGEGGEGGVARGEGGFGGEGWVVGLGGGGGGGRGGREGDVVLGGEVEEEGGGESPF